MASNPELSSFTTPTAATLHTLNGLPTFDLSLYNLWLSKCYPQCVVVTLPAYSRPCDRVSSKCSYASLAGRAHARKVQIPALSSPCREDEDLLEHSGGHLIDAHPLVERVWLFKNDDKAIQRSSASARAGSPPPRPIPRTIWAGRRPFGLRRRWQPS
jgi:hypothetical protein